MAEPDVVAIHEASHCVVATCLGLPVRWVTLGDHPHYELRDALRPDQRMAEILTLMAGGEGERALLNREPRGTGSDDPKIASLLDAADNEAALRREVRLFIAGNYPAVLRVAHALLRDGYLTGEEVAQLVCGRTLPHGHP